jgi:hypothetical protein
VFVALWNALVEGVFLEGLVEERRFSDAFGTI